MSVLQSERIRVIALTPEQVSLQVNNLLLLEEQLGLNPNSIEMDKSFEDELIQAINSYTIPKLKEHPTEQKWFTSWIIVHKTDNVYIGSLGAGSLPNEEGEVLFGYFVDRKYNGQGLATEAAKLFIDHLFLDKRLSRIAATIPIGHKASEKVVAKNGFVVDSRFEEEGMLVNKWILER